MPSTPAMKPQFTAIPTALEVVREATNSRVRADAGQVPFQRALSLLRGTRSRITLCRINFWGEVSEECGVLLNRLFGKDAMIEQIDHCTYILMFVRRPDDEECVERHVLFRLAQTMQPAFGRRFRATLSSSHHDSETLCDSDDLLALMEQEQSKGAKIVTI